MVHIGQRIRAVRDAKRLTLQQVAARLGVVHTTVHDYESAADLRLSTIRKLAEILEVSTAYLCGDDAELEQLEVTAVVQRESLRCFLQVLSPSRVERRRFERIRDHDVAPRTVQDWRRLYDLLAKFLGSTPGGRTNTAPERAVSTTVPEPSRMVRMKLEDRGGGAALRRVG